MSSDKWATSKSTQLATKVWVKLLLLLENALKLNSEALELKFEPSPRPHTHSDPTINKHTRQVKNYGFIMTCIDLYVRGQNSLPHRKARIWLPWLQKKIADTPTKTRWSWAQFQKGQPTPCKLCMLFPAHLWVREFWPQIYSLWLALAWGLLSKIRANMKMGGDYNAERSTF